jgi:hypothetical protein
LVCRYEKLTKEVDHVGLGQDRLWSAVRRLDWEKMAAIVKAAHDQHGVRVTSLADLKAYVGGVI